VISKRIYERYIKSVFERYLYEAVKSEGNNNSFLSTKLYNEIRIFFDEEIR